ncbi:M1 family aminopeptidase [Dyella acidisoli]|uniref:Peptidase M1 membrane alanine aminopeptidase domain-containing protein n=1 Tax=Dyella acidisoli TaxID=1867834 RepID=A0ABQ5XKQ4_9GAMM|nr:M1 family aminopeptidase [Dyella acidisoli]GLQ91577.1 hypothetical protein GCM10007901_05270 [Dyella acidisoli]
MIALGGLSIIGQLVAVMFVGTSLLRDDRARTVELIQMTGVPRASYFSARFAAGYLLSLFTLLATVVALVVGYQMPWLPANSLGPMPWSAFAMATGALIAPNLFFGAAMVAASIAFTRSMKYTVVAVVSVLVLHNVGNTMTHGASMLSAMLDPFAGQAMIQMADKWTADQLNSAIPLSGTFWLNRLFWLAVSTALAWGAYWRFGSLPDAGKAAHANSTTESAVPPIAHTPSVITVPRVGGWSEVIKAWHIARTEFAQYVSGVPFLCCVVLIAGVVAVYLLFERSIEGTPVYPLTHFMLRQIEAAIPLPISAILAFYSGEMIHREREERLASLVDAYPVSEGAWLAGKTLALLGLLTVLVDTGVMTAIGFQLLRDVTAIEPALYVQGALLIALPLGIFAVAALAMQLLAGNRMAGYALTALLGALPIGLAKLGVQDHLALFGTTPPIRYSDMSGFGSSLAAAGSFDLYWGVVGVALLLFASALHIRGDSDDARSRWALARVTFRNRRRCAWLASLMVVFAVTGAWIFYNTHLLNDIHPEESAQTRQATYEHNYRSLIKVPQPRVTDVNLSVDLHPSERRVCVDGIYLLTNESSQPIDTLIVSVDPTTNTTLHVMGMRSMSTDTMAGVIQIHLAAPIAPGQSLRMAFETTDERQGFTNNSEDDDLVADGTFLDNRLLPSIGYNHMRELTNARVRSAHGLPPYIAVMDATHPYVSDDAGRITFHAVVATDGDQTPLAPGRQVRAWRKDGRSYAEYVSERPMLNLYVFLSARWQVTRTTWKGVVIEVYADPKHPWNVNRIITALKDGLDAYGKAYGPYPLSEIRVAEFPSYRVFAQSFAGLIAYSEALGFTSHRDDPSGIDYPYFITAHEFAHQWWGHLLVPADAPGARLLTESMAQFSAIQLVDQHEHTSLNALLASERDAYQTGKQGLAEPEEPLDEVQRQDFVAYHKGALALMDYQRLAGAPLAEQTMRQFLIQYREKEAPYPLARDFIDALRASLPSSDHARVEAWSHRSGLPE